MPTFQDGPLYKGQQFELEMDMGINLDNYFDLNIVVTPENSNVQTRFSATRVAQTGKVKHVFISAETANFEGRYGFQPEANFGNNNIVPGKTWFFEFQRYGT